MPELSDLYVLADIGSTTTKAMLLATEPDGEGFSILGEADVPTTVEKPSEDVLIGLGSALSLLSSRTETRLVDPGTGLPCVPLLATSSAGGGLQILVFGLTSVDTGRVARMTAYGAGGVILRTITIDSDTQAVEQMMAIRRLRPDMVLMAGGVEGGAVAGVIRLAEILSLAEPEARFRGADAGRIPLVYCGNSEAANYVTNLLSAKFEVHLVENVRPDTVTLNLTPAKTAIHDLFMRNVMERAPGYSDLGRWVAADILPTPAAVERALPLILDEGEEHLLLMDMGGATTDIFSNIGGTRHRTVSANIGTSFSISNILAEAGLDRILSHLPDSADRDEIADYLMNKTLNPTYTPGTPFETLAELAAAIEGARIAMRQHVSMSFEIRKLGILDRLRRRNMERFEATFRSEGLVDFRLSELDRLVGAGGIVRFAGSRDAALWMLADGLLPTGVTRISADGRFKTPHMGLFSAVDRDSARDILRSRCIEDLGYVIAPVGALRAGREALTARVIGDGSAEVVLEGGETALLEGGRGVEIELRRHVFLRGGRSRIRLETGLPVLIDCRGRGDDMFEGSLGIPESVRVGLPEKISGTAPLVSSEMAASPIERGAFELDRSLPYEGTVFADENDDVEPDTIIGENRFAPPWLYILDLNQVLGYSRSLSADDVRRGIRLEEGQEVRPGQVIFSLRKDGVLGQVVNYRSPVRGRVTHVELDAGLVILRVIQDYDGKPHVIDVAGQLGVRPRSIRGYLRYGVGDFLCSGQAIARDVKKGIFVRTPTTGVMRRIDPGSGTVTVRYDIRPVPLRSLVRGRVTRVRRSHGVTIRATGIMLTARVGFGPDACGRLAPLSRRESPTGEARGMVLFSDSPVGLDDLERCSALGVSGLIVPSVRSTALEGFLGSWPTPASTGQETMPFSLLITEGFGSIGMGAECSALLEGSAGRLTTLFPATQIRAGVIRPRVLISSSSRPS